MAFVGDLYGGFFNTMVAEDDTPSAWMHYEAVPIAYDESFGYKRGDCDSSEVISVIACQAGITTFFSCYAEAMEACNYSESCQAFEVRSDGAEANWLKCETSKADTSRQSQPLTIIIRTTNGP